MHRARYGGEAVSDTLRVPDGSVMSPTQALATLNQLAENLSRVGRDGLLQRLGEAVEIGVWLAHRNRELDANATDVLARCSELLLENRRLRAASAVLAATPLREDVNEEGTGTGHTEGGR